MSALVPVQALETQLAARLGGVEVMLQHGELTLEVARERWVEAARVLRDEFGFEQCVDLCGVDFMGYGADEWDTQVSSQGFSRGVEGRNVGRFKYGQVPTQQAPQPEAVVIEPIPERRFTVVAHLLSIRHNQRLRLRTFCTDDALPRVDSLITIWPGVDWFEREAFDMFGVVFDGHPDLRRILTDYGFVGHPFRKDFPLIGNVEVRYDAGRQRIVYEPVTSVEPRVGVPRVVREDARQLAAAGEAKDPVKPTPRIGPADAWANRGTP